MVKNKYNYTPVQKEPKNFSPLVAYIFGDYWSKVPTNGKGCVQ